MIIFLGGQIMSTCAFGAACKNMAGAVEALCFGCKCALHAACAPNHDPKLTGPTVVALCPTCSVCLRDHVPSCAKMFTVVSWGGGVGMQASKVLPPRRPALWLVDPTYHLGANDKLWQVEGKENMFAIQRAISGAGGNCGARVLLAQSIGDKPGFPKAERHHGRRACESITLRGRRQGEGTGDCKFQS